ncbi:MAG: hypothetical protein QOC69_4918 [Mycobacterium sp.]|jgi:hypothetical protein|nr:hypothetical protein [Mycobacterium sp.]
MTATTPQASSPKRLGVNAFTAPGKAVVGERPSPFGEPLGWDPITSTLIYGEYDAVLVDTLATVAEAEALADWVALSLHVPSIDLVVGGDVLYNQCHMYVGDTTPESRRNWIEALDRLAALHPKIAIAGHKKPDAPDLPSAIQDSKRYLEDFGRLQKSTTTDEELFNEMTKRYPDWESNQSWLMFGFTSFPEPTED